MNRADKFAKAKADLANLESVKNYNQQRLYRGPIRKLREEIVKLQKQSYSRRATRIAEESIDKTGSNESSDV